MRQRSIPNEVSRLRCLQKIFQSCGNIRTKILNKIAKTSATLSLFIRESSYVTEEQTVINTDDHESGDDESVDNV